MHDDWITAVCATSAGLIFSAGHDGTLVARVQPLQGGQPAGDLSEGLINAGLASLSPDCA